MSRYRAVKNNNTPPCKLTRHYGKPVSGVMEIVRERSWLDERVKMK